MPEYVDYAEFYDRHHGFAEDIPFYLAYAEENGAPILELACGTGRILLPLAEAGHALHGLDLSENMLRVARDKIAEAGLEDSVSLTHADMADFDLGEKGFSLAICAFRSFMHLYTQQDQRICLRRLWEHLRPGGLFVVDVYCPNLELLSRPPDGEFELRREFDLPNGHHVVRKDRFVR